ncbi:hypothetical protein GJAV_G00151230 [Gymnothorax javanicus]|nr:hypothetical protein GJAV_G00151230 [Gymnothorax javanicus]
MRSKEGRGSARCPSGLSPWSSALLLNKLTAVAWRVEKDRRAVCILALEPRFLDNPAGSEQPCSGTA